MKEKNLKKIFWSEASLGGLILGLLLFGFLYLSYRWEWSIHHPTLASVTETLLIAVVSYIMARRMGRLRGAEGFTYGQSMGFILAMMVFTGIIYGLGSYLMQVVIDPEYYRNLYEATLYNTLDETQAEQALKMRQQMNRFIQNPGVMVLSGIFSMLIYGGIVGLIVSIFTKRQHENGQTQNDSTAQPE